MGPSVEWMIQRALDPLELRHNRIMLAYSGRGDQLVQPVPGAY